MDVNSIAILIPAYNEENTVRNVVERCLVYSKNVIIVDDGSTDGTIDQIAHLPVILLKNKINRGKGASLQRGFEYIISQKFSGVITLDADCQHNPDDLDQFFKLIAQNSKSIIIGARKLQTDNAPRKRLWANKIADFFISLAARRKLQDTQSGFRYYPTDFLLKINLNKTASCFAFETEILITAVRHGFWVAYVEIHSCYPKEARESHYRGMRDSLEIIKSVSKMIF